MGCFVRCMFEIEPLEKSTPEKDGFLTIHGNVIPDRNFRCVTMVLFDTIANELGRDIEPRVKVSRCLFTPEDNAKVVKHHIDRRILEVVNNGKTDFAIAFHDEQSYDEVLTKLNDLIRSGQMPPLVN